MSYFFIKYSIMKREGYLSFLLQSKEKYSIL